MSIRQVLAGVAALLTGVALVFTAASLANSNATTASDTGSAGAITTMLSPMPAGHVRVAGTGMTRQIELDATGLTPGSTHEVDLVKTGCLQAMTMGRMRSVTSMGTVKAGSGGAVSATISATEGTMNTHQSLLILLGDGGMGSTGSAVVACGSLHHGTAGSALRAVSKTDMPLSGQAQLSYDAAAQSLTVHVDAAGFTPRSLHAAHIHSGSCQAQGPVVYMLQDLRANGNGVIDATRSVTGVTGAPPASGWYLNIHMGSSQQILAGGQPTLQFQPRLCGDIVGDGSGAGSSGPATHGQITTSGGEHFLSPGQMNEKIMTVGPFTFTADCTSVQSNGQTHTQASFNVVSTENGSDLDGGGPVPAGTVVNIHMDPSLQGTPQVAPGAFAQSPSASTSTEIAPDGTEVDVFYNDGVNLDGHACFAGAAGFTS